MLFSPIRGENRQKSRAQESSGHNVDQYKSAPSSAPEPDPPSLLADTSQRSGARLGSQL